MNPPITTDSLYKFTALSGLTIVILIPIYYLNQIRERNQNMIKVETEILVIGEDWELIKSQLNDVIESHQNIEAKSETVLENANSIGGQLQQIEQQIDRLDRNDFENLKNQLHALNQQNDRLRVKRDSLTKDSEQLNSQCRELRKKIAELTKQTHILGGKRMELTRIERDLSQLKWMMLIAWIVGFSLCVGGFYLWYKRLQQYQDMTVKREALKKQ